MKKFITAMAIVGTIAVLVLVILFNSIAIVPVNHVGIMLHAGVVQTEELSEGWHFKVPFVDKVISMSNAVQSARIATGVKDATTSETAETLDQQLIPVFEFEVQYQLAKARSFEVFKNYGSNYEKLLIINNATACIKRVFSTYNSEEIVAHKSDIPLQIAEMMNEIVQPTGMTVVRVNMKNYDFTPEYTKLLEERAMSKAQVENNRINQQNELIKAQTAKDVAVKQAEQAAETERIAAENAKAVALINAQAEADAKAIAAENERQIAMTKAQSQAEADKIKVDSDAYVVKTKAEADKTARLAAAEATKAELEAQSAGLNELIIQRQFIENWDGHLVPSLNGSGSFTYADLTDILKNFMLPGGGN